MITEVKKMVENFFTAEANSFDTRTKVRDLQAVNEAFAKMHEHTVKELEGMLGQIYLSELRDDNYYESNKNNSLSLPRHLFKITHYKHPKYSNVWVVYASERSPYEDFKQLSNAFFVIQQEGNYKVGSQFIYSNSRGMSQNFDWEWIAGITDLNFDDLHKHEAIERYQEPFDYEGMLELYLSDK